MGTLIVIGIIAGILFIVNSVLDMVEKVYYHLYMRKCNSNLKQALEETFTVTVLNQDNNVQEINTVKSKDDKIH